MARIGIYGGTFNPPHIGHIKAAKIAVSSLGLDTLFLIPDRIAPHKTLPENSPSPEQRLAMLRVAAQGSERLCASDIELRREGTSYTYLTVEQLRKSHPNDSLVLLMGTDMFLSFLTWREPDRILKNAELAVLYRGQADEKNAVEAQKALLLSRGARVTLVENEIVQISSTDVRRMLTFRCAESLLPSGVGAYIEQAGLYGVNRSLRGLSEQELEREVVQLLDPKRVAHVLGCRDTAVQLARKYGANETDASRSALLHDVTKALATPLQLTLCREYGIVLDDFPHEIPRTLHALTGSLVAQRIFGENDAVLRAICSHTTGKPDMDLLEKILYIADYIEPSRDFPDVARLRAAAWEDLDKGVLMGLEMTIAMLARHNQAISPVSEKAAQFLRQKGIKLC